MLSTHVPSYKLRYLRPHHGEGSIVNTDQAPTAGRVMLHQIEVPFPCTVDAIVINNGTAVAGNVTVGIYGPLAALTTATCAGAALLIASNSTAVSGTSNPQVISLTAATAIDPGKYYLAIEYDDAGTMKYQRHGNGTQVVGWVQFYDRAGGYGALTNPCPAITETGSAAVGCTLRISA